MLIHLVIVLLLNSLLIFSIFLPLILPLPILLPWITAVFLSRLFLREAGDDLDLFGVELVLVVHFEVDVLNDESPHFVTEAVGVEMALNTIWISRCLRF